MIHLIVKRGQIDILIFSALEAIFNLETEDVTESILFEQEIAAKPRAEITQVTVDKDYVEKQGNVKSIKLPSCTLAFTFRDIC